MSTTPITLTFPKLSQEKAEALSNALLAAQAGQTVEVAITYTKQTKAAPRKAGTDYRPLLGTSSKTLIGKVLKVAVGKNGAYVLLDTTLVRAPLNAEGKVEADEVGFTAIKPTGVEDAQVLKVEAAQAVTTK